MKNVSRIIPCYSADTAGVCSALYELGGMVVTHDASGCNSTYATHDEPRWYDMQSKMYISALTELDAIMGNDEKLISDVVSAAADQKPEFIAVCGSPMPMMTGVDFDAIASEIERRSGIRTFGLHTTGTHSYIAGAGEALCEIVKEYFVSAPTKKDSVNILGATPPDFGINGAVDTMKRRLEENGYDVISVIAMGCTLDDIRRSGSASANLVVSAAGLPAAQYMQQAYGIPYVTGVPLSDALTKEICALLRSGECGGIQASQNGSTAVIGESIFSASAARDYSLSSGRDAYVICPLDSNITGEDDIRRCIADADTVIADPLYGYILSEGTKLIEMPHFAFSGRCFGGRISDLKKMVWES